MMMISISASQGTTTRRAQWVSLLLASLTRSDSLPLPSRVHLHLQAHTSTHSKEHYSLSEVKSTVSCSPLANTFLAVQENSHIPHLPFNWNSAVFLPSVSGGQCLFVGVRQSREKNRSSCIHLCDTVSGSLTFIFLPLSTRSATAIALLPFYIRRCQWLPRQEDGRAEANLVCRLVCRCSSRSFISRLCVLLCLLEW